MKTSELTGTALDWAVATAEGYSDYDTAMGRLLAPRKEYGWVDLCNLDYSTSWSLAGPIIERELIQLSPQINGRYKGQWAAHMWRENKTGALVPNTMYGPTPLIAAMRCFMAAKLGDEIDVPEELT
jgi:hypothetical protein